MIHIRLNKIHPACGDVLYNDYKTNSNYLRISLVYLLFKFDASTRPNKRTDFMKEMVIFDLIGTETLTVIQFLSTLLHAIYSPEIRIEKLLNEAAKNNRVGIKFSTCRKMPLNHEKILRKIYYV